MAIYTTVFLSRPGQLSDGFPGWRLPLAQAVRREIRNPFTREIMVVETREPEWFGEPAGSPQMRFGAVAIKGRFEDYLEGRLPPFVRGCPHWAAKGLTVLELAPLIVGTGVPEPFEQPIYAPPSLGASIHRFPPAFVARLGVIDLDSVAERWAMEMSKPEYTHSVSGKRLSADWTTAQALAVLNPLAALAGNANDGQLMYLLIEA